MRAAVARTVWVRNAPQCLSPLSLASRRNWEKSLFLTRQVGVCLDILTSTKLPAERKSPGVLPLRLPAIHNLTGIWR